ncbi:hypothetical protein T281_05560 [Rhodomicrobium udaipurense JA643]|nr:hypothetical protein T281_05560 [Rhodomicrobium udaipurense JA643]
MSGCQPQKGHGAEGEKRNPAVARHGGNPVASPDLQLAVFIGGACHGGRIPWRNTARPKESAKGRIAPTQHIFAGVAFLRPNFGPVEESVTCPPTNA